jgi:alpha-1,2-mannosyltransferase
LLLASNPQWQRPEARHGLCASGRVFARYAVLAQEMLFGTSGGATILLTQFQDSGIGAARTRSARPTRLMRGLHALGAGIRDARWLTRQRLSTYPKLFVAAYLIVAALQLAMTHAGMYPNGQPIGADFVNVWAASASALKGHPAAIYNSALHHQMEQAALSNPRVGLYGWHYPPMFLIVALPLALLPYLWAYFAWEGLTLAAYAGVMKRLVPAREGLWLALAFAPVMINFTNGQNGFVTCALFAGGLMLLEDNPLGAGICFGLLTYKPQFGLLIPLALIAARRWRAFAGAAVTGAVFALLSLGLFGIETWRAFFASIAFTRGLVLEHGAIEFFKLQSAFGAVRMWGGAISLAYAAQTLIALAGAAAVLWLWRRESKAPFALKAAALCLGSLMISPYVLDYDLVLLALPIAWMALDGCERGFLPYEKSALVAAWLFPAIARMVAESTMIPLGPVVHMALLALIVRRALWQEAIPQVREGVHPALSAASAIR